MSADESALARLLRLETGEVEALRAWLGEARFGAAIGQWGFTRRGAQVPPEGAWHSWLVMAGRGFGKTRTGAEWVEAMRQRSHMRIALVGATHHDVRAVMIEGPSGLLSATPFDEVKRYEPSKRRLVWMNGASAEWFSAEEPDSLRGPQFHYAWGDEIARWPDGPAVWANLQMALRMGNRPRAVLTTTPRPVPLVRALLEGVASGRVAVTRGRTADNAAHLPAAFIEAVTETYGGTRLGRQELDGELIEEVAGALWTREGLERCRILPLSPQGRGARVAPCRDRRRSARLGGW